MFLVEDNELRHFAAKWYVVLTLLVGLFSTTAFEVTQSGLKQVLKTEQVVSANERAKKIYCFKWIVPSYTKSKITSGVSHHQLKVAAVVYSRCIQIKERATVKRMQSFKSPAKYFRSVFIPLSSDEDNSNPTRG